MIEIKDNYFKAVDGNLYFRRNSLAVSLGGYGPKKTPVFQANYLSVDGHLNYDFLGGHVNKSGPFDIDWSASSQADIGGSLDTYFDVGGVQASFDHQKAKIAKLKLLRFNVDANPLKTILNTQALAVRQAMKNEGNDARICSSVWVVVSGLLGERFASSVSITAEATTTSGLKISAQGGGSWSGSESITYSSGAVLAYALHKVKKWDGERIADMEDDWLSIG